jgi:hypothetical protein
MRFCVRRVVLLFVSLAMMAGGGLLSAAPGVAAQGEVCPNEAVRGESALNPETQLPVSMRLPDCRGYELVSPPYTEGFAVTGVAAVSADGSRMIAGSFGAFAGTESDPVSINVQLTGGGPAYEFTREGSGWVASPLDPSAGRFTGGQKFAGVSRDLTKTLWAAREPSESIYAQDLYVREADGAVVKVGSMVPPSVSGLPAGYVGEEPGELSVVGTSSDLSHVLFTIRVPNPGGQSFLWPGDTTSYRGGYTLYEYTGTGNSHPDLVGVNDEGALISGCSTWLGGEGESGDKYNAVSSDGEKVFFTPQASVVVENRRGEQEVLCSGPEVNEVYARIDGSATVDISEPSAAQCSACNTSVKSPAEFAGASEDGSKVFFLGEGLLAGATGSNLYEYDFENPENAKIVQVSRGAPGYESPEPGVDGVARVSEDGTHVYFVARGVLTGANEEGKGKSPTEGEPNLYVFERDRAYPLGRTAFVATLSEGDARDWGSFNTGLVQATPDGRFLVFSSGADLTPDDTSTVPQIFEYDALREKLVRVSVGQKAPGGYECPITKKMEEGYNCDGNAEEERDQPEFPETRAGLAAISSDGSYVFFHSADGLTPGALDNQLVNEYERQHTYAQNVYEYHSSVASEGGSIVDGNVSLISDGRDRTLHNITASGVQLYGTDASGQDVFFSSGDPLVAQDTDTQVGVYDARVGGGFPAPVSPVSCEGEACQGTPPSPLSFGAPASSSAAGGGNLTPPAESTPATKPKSKSKSLTRAQKLARALQTCRGKPKRKRATCEAQARKQYGAKAKAKKSDGRSR